MESVHSPTIYVKGKTVNTDKTWKVTYEDKEWIDESGKASDTSATVYMDAGCWNFDGATQLPSKFSLARKPMKAVSSTPGKKGYCTTSEKKPLVISL